MLWLDANESEWGSQEAGRLACKARVTAAAGQMFAGAFPLLAEQVPGVPETEATQDRTHAAAAQLDTTLDEARWRRVLANADTCDIVRRYGRVAPRTH